MNKKYAIVITVLFCLFIFGFGAAFLIAPDRAFSPQENRYLAQFKAPTLNSLKSGQFMKDFEDYVIDQFPLRDGWIQLKARMERLLGKRENNGVYFGQDGQTLFAQYTAPSEDDLAARVDHVNRLGENLNIPVYFSLVPDKSYVWAERLPDNAPKVDDGSLNEKVRALLEHDVTFIDLYTALSGENVFYRTDHHWTTMGAHMGFLALSKGMGRSGVVLEEDEPVLRSDSFYGTTWSSAGAGWVKPDSIYTLVPEGGKNGQVTVTRYPEGRPIPGSLYDLSKLEQKDKYAMFLGGNQPLCVIQNPEGGGGRLLVVRDSYSDALAPFLALDYQEVHLFDLRYNNMSLKQYVEDHQIDRVLVCYSAANFTSDNNLFKLGL